MPRATTERKLRELQRRGLVSRHGRGFIIPVDSLNQPRMAETLERLILMIHKASAKLPKADNGNRLWLCRTPRIRFK